MPYASKAQAAYMHIHHPEIAKKWDKEGKGYVEHKKTYSKEAIELARRKG